MQIQLKDRFLSAACKVIRHLPAGRRSAFLVPYWAAGAPDRFVLVGDPFHFVVDCQDYDVAMRVALSRCYEPAVGALFLARVKPGDCVFDIGANKGYYTLLACRHVGPAGRVIGYEAEPRNLADLNDDFALNSFANLKVVGKAVSDAAGEALFSNAGWAEQNSAWGQIVRPDTPPAEATRVETCAVDDELDELGIDVLHMLKMDIQGGEFAAVKGMVKSLRTHRIKNVLLELHDLQLNQKECEFIVSALHDAGYTGRCYDQAEFSDAESVAALNGVRPLELATRGFPTSEYSFAQRAARPGYRKPLQFLMHC